MKWFQPIECDNTVKNPLVCDNDNLEECGYDEFSFKAGKAITDWNSTIFMKSGKAKYDGSPDDALQNHLMVPVYSERLINQLVDADIKGIQYLPIKILRYNNEHINGFSVANFLNFIEAFDFSRSDYNRFSDDFPNPNVRGEIAGVKRFVLRKERLEGFDIIRLKEYELRYFVSERFKDIFVKNKFTGYSFREIELV